MTDKFEDVFGQPLQVMPTFHWSSFVDALTSSPMLSGYLVALVVLGVCLCVARIRWER